MDVFIYVSTVLSFLITVLICVIFIKKIFVELKTTDVEDVSALPLNYKWKKFRNSFIKPVLYLIVPLIISIVASIFNPYFQEAVKPEPYAGAMFSTAVCFIGFYVLFGSMVKKRSLISDSWEVLLNPAGGFAAIFIVETAFISACAFYTVVSLLLAL